MGVGALVFLAAVGGGIGGMVVHLLFTMLTRWLSRRVGKCALCDTPLYSDEVDDSDKASPPGPPAAGGVT